MLTRVVVDIGEVPTGCLCSYARLLARRGANVVVNDINA